MIFQNFHDHKTVYAPVFFGIILHKYLLFKKIIYIFTTQQH